MKKLNTFTGGHPLKLDDLAYLQAGVIDALKGVVDGLGTNSQNFILQGVVVTTFTYTGGYIYFNGEIYPVDAGSVPPLGLGHQYYWQVDEVTESPSPTTYQNSVVRAVHVRRRMKLVEAAVLPVNAILAASVIRLNQILGLTPQRGIIMYSGSSTNFDVVGKGKTGTQLDGWALCNGGTFAVPGGGTLTTPNLRGKFIVGFDERTSGADPDYNAIGDTGGEKTHTLVKSELPPHKHDLTPDMQLVADTSSGSPPFTIKPFIDNDAGSTTTLSPYGMSAPHLSEDGAIDGLTGAAHENRPPFYTLAYIIKLL